MPYDRLPFDSCSKLFTAPTRHHDGHVTWTGCPRYDVTTPQCLYSQHQTSSSVYMSPITGAQWPYVPPPTATDWLSAPPNTAVVSASWGCTSDSSIHRVHGCSYSPTDAVVPAWQFARCDRATSYVGGTCKLTTSMTPRTSSETHHHQLVHMSHFPPVTQDVSSSSQFIIDDDTNHQFGTRPTRASTSIGQRL